MNPFEHAASNHRSRHFKGKRDAPALYAQSRDVIRSLKNLREAKWLLHLTAHNSRKLYKSLHVLITV